MGNIRHFSDCYYRHSASPTSGEYLGEIYLIATVGLVDGACTDVSQEFHEVSRFDKREKLRDLLSMCPPKEKSLVFAKIKKTADFIATHLSVEGFPATSIHGDRLQREREEALFNSWSGKMNILVTTTVTARTHVVNFDMPEEIDEYVPKVGQADWVGGAVGASRGCNSRGKLIAVVVSKAKYLWLVS